MSLSLHIRLQITKKAELELSAAVCDIVEKNGLTMVEAVRMLAKETEHWTVYALRAERHPKNPNKKADEA